MIVKGKLITCKREVKEFEKRSTEEKLWLTLAEVVLSDEQKKELEEAFKDAGKKFTPDWIKNFNGYVNVSTQFDLAYCFGKTLAGELGDTYAAEGPDVLSLIKEGFPYMGAEAKLSLALKDGAVYPNSIKFITKGNAFNPFAEFEDDEED